MKCLVTNCTNEALVNKLCRDCAMCLIEVKPSQLYKNILQFEIDALYTERSDPSEDSPYYLVTLNFMIEYLERRRDFSGH